MFTFFPGKGFAITVAFIKNLTVLIDSKRNLIPFVVKINASIIYNFTLAIVELKFWKSGITNGYNPLSIVPIMELN